MRTLLAAALLLGLLLPVGVEAKPFSAGRSETSARKAKSSRRSTDNAPLVVDGASSKRSKRRADDPVLRRYGKKPQDVAYVEYDADKVSKKSAKKSKKTSDEILVIEDAPAKKSAKKSKAVKVQADEEILIIEETPAAKKPVKAKAEKPAKKAKKIVADDDDEKPTKAKKSIVDDDDDDDKPVKKSSKKNAADDEITITLD